MLAGLRCDLVRGLNPRTWCPHGWQADVAGRRSFGDFLEEYAAPVEGAFVDVDQPQRALGRCRNMLALTHGQRAGIGGADARRAHWCCLQG